jgi:hypothetical protein
VFAQWPQSNDNQPPRSPFRPLEASQPKRPDRTSSASLLCWLSLRRRSTISVQSQELVPREPKQSLPSSTSGSRSPGPTSHSVSAEWQLNGEHPST